MGISVIDGIGDTMFDDILDKAANLRDKNLNFSSTVSRMAAMDKDAIKRGLNAAAMQGSVVGFGIGGLGGAVMAKLMGFDMEQIQTIGTAFAAVAAVGGLTTLGLAKSLENKEIDNLAGVPKIMKELMKLSDDREASMEVLRGLDKTTVELLGQYANKADSPSKPKM